MTFKQVIRYSPPVIWMVVMFYLSSQSNLPSNEVYVVDFVSKKFSHIVEYIILTVLWTNALNRPTPDLAVLFSLMYAFVDETHQLFVPNRTGNLRDVGIDLIGISIAAVILVNFKQWKTLISPRRSKKHKQ